MKKLDSILFFLALGLFPIGIHQSIVLGISQAYWIFMLCLALLFLYGYRKNQGENPMPKDDKGKRKNKSNKRKK